MRYLAFFAILTLAACAEGSSYPGTPNYSQDRCFDAMGNGFKVNHQYLEKTGVCPKKG